MGGPHYTQQPGWDPTFGKRITIAIAVAIVAHAFIAAFVTYRSAQNKENSVVAQRVTIERHPVQVPTPVPTPRPTPRAAPTPQATAHSQRASAPQVAEPTADSGGQAAPKRIIVAQRPLNLVLITPAPLRVAANSSSHGGNAAGVSDGGSGTGAGNGPGGGGGSGGSGNGTGGDGASPCGYVDLVASSTKSLPDGSQVVQVSVEVHLRDGETMYDELHWPFNYPNEEANPFSPVHRGDNFPTLFQFPPQGYDVADNQKAATVFVVKHTKPNGRTDLPDCPPA